jgi:hypothetical protein
MAIVSNGPATLLTGLSSFWQRIFADQSLLQNFYNGTMSLMGQVYLNMLETVLSTSINTCPPFHKELWSNIVINQADIEYNDASTPADQRWFYPLPNNVTFFQYLYNQIFAPTVILEYGLDFDFDSVPSADGTTQTTYIAFYADPFTSNDGGIINGLAYTNVQIVPLVYATGSDGIIGTIHSTSNLFHSDSIELTSYDTTHQLLLTSTVGNVSGLYNIVSVSDLNDCTLEYASGAQVLFNYNTGVQWSLQSKATVPQVSMWSPDAEVDDMFLAQNFGNLIGIFQPSSETYQALIQGVFQYFMLGPAVERMEAALNVMNGFPVAQSDSEVALSYDGTTGILTTNLDVYGPFSSAMPIRPDIVASVTAVPSVPFPLQAFSPLSDAFNVSDRINDPDWWNNINIPSNLLTLGPVPALPSNVVNNPTNVANFATYWAGRSQVTPNLYPSICGLPVDSTGTGDVNYFNALYGGYVLPDVYDVPVCGDPGLICGADEDGFIPNISNRPPLHHNYAYQVFHNYIQYNSFQITVASGVSLSFSNQEFQQVIVAGKPAYVFCFSDLFT